MAKEECRIAGYKLLGEYVFSEILADFIRDENWSMAYQSIKATRSALEGSLKESYITSGQLATLAKRLGEIETAVARRQKKEADSAFADFFRDYGTVIIDAVAECECKRG